MAHQVRGNLREAAQAHEYHDGAGGLRQAVEVLRQLSVGVAGVRSDYGEAAAEPAVRQRDTGQRRDGIGAADARYLLAGDAGLGQGEHFLAAAPEYVRVASLEAHNALALPGQTDELGTDFILAGCLPERLPMYMSSACEASASMSWSIRSS